MNAFQSALNVCAIRFCARLGAGFLNNYLSISKRGAAYSEKLLLKLVRDNRNTEYGKKYDFGNIQSIEDYQKKVPLSDYNDYRDYIRRTVDNNEQGLITCRRINYCATTSGTSKERKLIPQTAATYFPYFKFICLCADQLVKAMRDRGAPSGPARGMLLIEVHSDPASEQAAKDKKGVQAGMVSSYGANGIGVFLPTITPMPKEVFNNNEIRDMKYIKARYALQDPDLRFIGGVFMSGLTDIMTYIEHSWELLVRDIENGTIDPSVDMSDGIRATLESRLRPDPARAAELKEIFTTPSETPLISRIWPNMSYIASIGTGDFTPFTRRMRGYCDDKVQFAFGMYAASEAPISSTIRAEDSRYLILPDGGFYEFLPVPEECEKMPERPLLMHELEVGRHYEIIITNLMGLYRYRIRDVVRVVGYEGQIPYIEFAYRATHITDLCGSHITGEHVANAVASAEAAVGAHVEDYSLYADAEHDRPRLELFYETEETLTAGQQARMEQVFESELQSNAWDYGYYRKGAFMDAAALRPVARGSYMRYRDMRIAQGASSNQFKAVRVIDTPEKLDFFRAAVIGGGDQE